MRNSANIYLAKRPQHLRWKCFAETADWAFERERAACWKKWHFCLTSAETMGVRLTK
jgi:hypothetical protein